MTYEIQPNDILIAFAGIEFDGKPAWITCQIREFTSEGDSREAYKDRSLNTLTAQKVCL